MPQRFARTAGFTRLRSGLTPPNRAAPRSARVLRSPGEEDEALGGPDVETLASASTPTR